MKFHAFCNCPCFLGWNYQWHLEYEFRNVKLCHLWLRRHSSHFETGWGKRCNWQPRWRRGERCDLLLFFYFSKPNSVWNCITIFFKYAMFPFSESFQLALSDMMCSEYDFLNKGHVIAQWYGLRDFVIIRAVFDEGVNTETRAKLLLSSMAVAINNTNW